MLDECAVVLLTVGNHLLPFGQGGDPPLGLPELVGERLGLLAPLLEVRLALELGVLDLVVGVDRAEDVSAEQHSEQLHQVARQVVGLDQGLDHFGCSLLDGLLLPVSLSLLTLIAIRR